MKKIDEPRTMAQAQNAVEELWPGKPYTVWIEDAGRTRHVSVRFGKGTNRVIVEGVGAHGRRLHRDGLDFAPVL
jgi:hypothetical protein